MKGLKKRPVLIYPPVNTAFTICYDVAEFVTAPIAKRYE